MQHTHCSSTLLSFQGKTARFEGGGGNGIWDRRVTHNARFSGIARLPSERLPTTQRRWWRVSSSDCE